MFIGLSCGTPKYFKEFSAGSPNLRFCLTDSPESDNPSWFVLDEQETHWSPSDGTGGIVIGSETHIVWEFLFNQKEKQKGLSLKSISKVNLTINY